MTNVRMRRILDDAWASGGSGSEIQERVRRAMNADPDPDALTAALGLISREINAELLGRMMALATSRPGASIP